MAAQFKAIRTHYHGPTNTKGSRISADDGDGNRVTLSYDSALNTDHNHEAAARALVDKMGWNQHEITGGWYGHDCYWVFVP